MQDFPRQARVALKVYLDRGREAVINLKSQNFEKVEEILRLRKAAFHNFRAADALAISNGLDVVKEKEIVDLWEQIKEVDTELEGLMTDARDAIQTKIADSKRNYFH